MSEIEKLVKYVHTQIEKCKAEQSVFLINLPEGDYKVKHEDMNPDSSILCGEKDTIEFPNGEKIVLVSKSLNRDRTFQINPDRSTVSVEVFSADGSLKDKFSDAWDESLY